MNSYAHTAGLHDQPVAWQGLRQVVILQSLSDQRLAELAEQCNWQQLNALQTVQGPWQDQRLYMLISGGLRVISYTASGRGLMLGEIEPGRFFGGLPAECEALNMSLVVEASESSLVASLSHEDVEKLLMNEPSVLRSFINRLSNLATTLAQRVVDLGTLSVRSRLHARLLLLAERAGVSEGQALLSPAPRQSDLALLLGTSREEVAREMSRLMRLGLLRREGRQLRICHVEGLRVLLEDAR
ncbi:Crp/Fnr family transcriptional regulator [Comamonas composti]|uniref:Crp/Fnr family transcriptional regulator n=1 Tax=Comamonas composti TaxID=408558 RepID=UPI0003FEE848|nr:Crp/Fnr family transcriptional regulator [Comamonas composti]